MLYKRRQAKLFPLCLSFFFIGNVAGVVREKNSEMLIRSV
jgi:hypothetical protein